MPRVGAARVFAPSARAMKPPRERLDNAARRPRAAVRARHAAVDGDDAADVDTTSMPAIYSAPDGSKEAAVLEKLRRVIDPDFGEDIVNCGFVKALTWTKARETCCLRLN